jgi:hypothetical protein
MVAQFEAAEARNKLEDLSGIKLKSGENPYNALIEACNDDVVSDPLLNPVIPKLTVTG